MTTLSVSSNATLDGQTTIGDGSGTENLFVYSPVGNSTVGFIPNGNTVLLGNTSNRWVLNANTGNFSGTISSGNVTVTGFINASSSANVSGTIRVGGAATLSNTLSVTGAMTTSGGINPTSNTSGQNLGGTGKRWVFYANTINTSGLITGGAGASITGTANASVGMNVGANVNLSTSKITVGTSSVNTAISSSGIDTDGTLDVLKASSFSNTMAVTGSATFSSSANVVGDFSIHGDIKDEGGNAFRVYYANGDVAWPA
jgi:fibronectin-binding autotransporter adhesin